MSKINIIFKKPFNPTGFYKYLLLLLLLCVAVISCVPSGDQAEFSTPFELSTFLKTHIRRFPGQSVEFQVLSIQGEPIPYGLLAFQWTEGGRMSFQTDQDGLLSMQFERDILDYEVMVAPESADAKLRVKW